MNKIKLLVFDVDGTLYDLKKHEVPKSAIEAINKAKAQGYKFVIATGRVHYALGKAINDLNPDYIISCNGAVLADKDGNIISKHDFKEEEFQTILKYIDIDNAGAIFKFSDHMYIYNNPSRIFWLEGQLNSDIGKEPFVFDDKKRHLVDMPQSLSIHINPAIVKMNLEKETDLDFIPYSDDGYDVVRRGLNKSTGIKDLIDYLNLDFENVMAFGDNFNDIAMLKASGISVAMGNAKKEVKEIANYITDATDENGIYNALKHFKII